MPDESAHLNGQKRPLNNKRFQIFVCVVVFILVLVVFLPSVYFSFVNWDDDTHVYKNALVTHPGEMCLQSRILTPNLGYPVPVLILFYRLEYLLFGLNPKVFHFTNVFLHFGSCLLLFFIARTMGIDRLGSAAAVLLFGIHPVISEPVSWISGRKDLLAAFWGLSAIALYIKRPLSLDDRLSWIVIPLFIAGALSKPVVLFIPILMFVWDVYFFDRPAKSSFLRAVPLLAFSLVIFGVALVGQQKVGAIQQNATFINYLREVWYALGYHLGLLFFINSPCMKHIPVSMPPPFDALVDLIPILVGGVFYAISRALLHPERRIYLAGWVFAGLAYLPSSSLIPLSRYLADSYLYLPMIGIGISVGAIVCFLSKILPYKLRPLLGLAICLTAIVLCFQTMRESSSWQNGVTLWQKAFMRYPDSPEVCRNYGNAINYAGSPEKALALYRECADRFGSERYLRNIAITLERVGRRDEAAEVWRQIKGAHD